LAAGHQVLLNSLLSAFQGPPAAFPRYPVDKTRVIHIIPLGPGPKRTANCARKRYFRKKLQQSGAQPNAAIRLNSF
jgi:hypothetical protein